MAAPPFSLPSVAPHSPQVSTIAYAAATNAVGHNASGEAADNATPPPIAAPSLRLASFLIRSIFRSLCLRPSQRLDLTRQMRPNGISLRDLIESPLVVLPALRSTPERLSHPPGPHPSGPHPSGRILRDFDRPIRCLFAIPLIGAVVATATFLVLFCCSSFKLWGNVYHGFFVRVGPMDSL